MWKTNLIINFALVRPFAAVKAFDFDVSGEPVSSLFFPVKYDTFYHDFSCLCGRVGPVLTHLRARLLSNSLHPT